VDLHKPTLESIRFFYTRMIPGGIIVSDDYDSPRCPGARLALNDYMKDKPEKWQPAAPLQAYIVKI
jgi:hypothetical protein